MNHRPDIIRVIHGRKGQPTEYVEYKPLFKSVKIVAQKSGDRIFIFRLENKAIQTIQSWPVSLSDKAVHQAHDMCINEVE